MRPATARLALAATALSSLLLLPAWGVEKPPPPTGKPHVERDGLVEFEAEEYQSIMKPETWELVPGSRGKAMKVAREGAWARHVCYDIDFKNAGTYHLWLLARKNPDARADRGNRVRVIVHPTENEQILESGKIIAELSLRDQTTFGWVDWLRNNSSRGAEFRIPSPGLYHLYLIAGSPEDVGWEIDALRLTRDNRQPPERNN